MRTMHPFQKADAVQREGDLISVKFIHWQKMKFNNCIWIALPSTGQPAKPYKLSKQSQVTSDITSRQFIH